jgi:hypothetical protein
MTQVNCLQKHPLRLKINTERFKRDYYPNKKYYKIFILTKDDYYFIIEKRKLYKSLLFKNIFDLDKTSGNINNPLFLRKQNSKNIKIIIEYLNFYYNKIDFFEVPNQITYNDINYYFNNFDREFFSKFEHLSSRELLMLINRLDYFNVPSLIKKFNFFLFFKKNKKRIFNDN